MRYGNKELFEKAKNEVEKLRATIRGLGMLCAGDYGYITIDKHQMACIISKHKVPLLLSPPSYTEGFCLGSAVMGFVVVYTPDNKYEERPGFYVGEAHKYDYVNTTGIEKIYYEQMRIERNKARRRVRKGYITYKQYIALARNSFGIHCNWNYDEVLFDLNYECLYEDTNGVAICRDDDGLFVLKNGIINEVEITEKDIERIHNERNGKK